jgi:hypothetical protein
VSLFPRKKERLFRPRNQSKKLNAILAKRRKARAVSAKKENQRTGPGNEMFKLNDALNVKQTADALRSSVYSVRLWIHQKKLSAYRVGGKYYCSPEDIAAFLAAGRVEAHGQNRAKRAKVAKEATK